MWQCSPAKRSARSFDDALHGAQRVAVLQAEAELRVLGAGLDELVRVRLDAGRDAHEHPAATSPRRRASASSRSSSSNESTTIRPTPAAIAARSSSVDLLLPWNTMRVGREAGVQRDVQLAAGRDVEVEALLGDEPRHRRAEERLARVRDAVAEARAVLAAARAELALVVHVERRAELGREADEVDAADREAAVGLDASRGGQQRQVERGLRASRHRPPNRPVVVVVVEAGHLLGRAHAEQAERVGEPDPARLRRATAAPG